MNTRVRVLMVAVLLGCLLFLASCGGDSSTPAPTPVVSVSISPTSKTISVTETAQFTATVTGSSNTAVTWSASNGTVPGGLFTPPMHSGSYTVTATSQADTSKSASATVTVTAPVPNFTSTPVPTASEATEYTYAVEATDPAGTEVTYVLTSGPEGATINGNTITWTPTAAQSRVQNTFIVTANTAAGGVGTQTWTVTPTGIIYGTYVDKYWTADGNHTDVPYDVTGWEIAALVPQEDGTFTELAGTGNADGKFTIPGVPAGHYWLKIFYDYYWTNSSSFDYGSDYIGRPYNFADTVSTNFAFNLTNLNPTIDCCYSLQFLSPNAGVNEYSWNYVDYGMTVFNYLEGPRTIMPIDPAQGDTSYVLQWDRVDRASNMAADTYVSAVTSGLALDSLATNPGGSDTTPIEGQMGGTPNAFDLSIKGSEWARLLMTAGPGMPQIGGFNAVIASLPFVTDKFALSPSSGGFELAYIEAGYTSIDQDLGVFRYINPYPASWKPLFMAQQGAELQVFAPGAGSPAYFYPMAAFMTDALPTGPIAPMMSSVRNPKINGGDFFVPSTTDAPSVTISWEAPTGLTPYAYEVVVSNIGDGWYSTWAYLYTSGTSLTIPAGVLQPGFTYVFEIRAMADGRATVNSPWRLGLPMADASIVSGALTIEGALTPTVSKTAAAINAMKTGKNAAILNHIQTRKLRSFTRIEKHAPTTKK